MCGSLSVSERNALLFDLFGVSLSYTRAQA